MDKLLKLKASATLHAAYIRATQTVIQLYDKHMYD